MMLVTSKFSEAFVESRREGLEAYLRGVLRLVTPEQLDLVDEFLHFSEHTLASALAGLQHLQHLQPIRHIVKALQAGTEGSTLPTADPHGAMHSGFDLDASFAAAKQGAAEAEAEALDDSVAGGVGGGGGGGDANASTASHTSSFWRSESLDVSGVLTGAVQALAAHMHTLESGNEDLASQFTTYDAVQRDLQSRLARTKEQFQTDLRNMQGKVQQLSEQCAVEREELRKTNAQIALLNREAMLVKSDTARLKLAHKASAAAFKRLRKELGELQGASDSWVRGATQQGDSPPPVPHELRRAAEDPDTAQRLRQRGVGCSLPVVEGGDVSGQAALDSVLQCVEEGWAGVVREAMAVAPLQGEPVTLRDALALEHATSAQAPAPSTAAGGGADAASVGSDMSDGAIDRMLQTGGDSALAQPLLLPDGSPATKLRPLSEAQANQMQTRLLEVQRALQTAHTVALSGKHAEAVALSGGLLQDAATVLALCGAIAAGPRVEQQLAPGGTSPLPGTPLTQSLDRLCASPALAQQLELMRHEEGGEGGMSPAPPPSPLPNTPRTTSGVPAPPGAGSGAPYQPPRATDDTVLHTLATRAVNPPPAPGNPFGPGPHKDSLDSDASRSVFSGSLSTGPGEGGNPFAAGSGYTVGGAGPPVHVGRAASTHSHGGSSLDSSVALGDESFEAMAAAALEAPAEQGQGRAPRRTGTNPFAPGQRFGKRAI